MGTVIERIDNHINTGRVRVEREEWVADSEGDAIIERVPASGSRGVVGAHLVVELPDTANDDSL